MDKRTKQSDDRQRDPISDSLFPEAKDTTTFTPIGFIFFVIIIVIIGIVVVIVN